MAKDVLLLTDGFKLKIKTSLEADSGYLLLANGAGGGSWPDPFEPQRGYIERDGRLRFARE